MTKTNHSMRGTKIFLAMTALSAAAFFMTNLLRGEETFGTKEIRGVVYKTVGSEELKMNFFLPTKDGKPLENLPTLIFIDSGCWCSNGPGDGGYWGVFGGVQKGFAVVSVGHRSLATVSFPAQIEDVRAAVRFLRAHAKEYGLNPNRFASMGCSSGGNLSTTLGIADGVCPFDVGENLDQSSQVQAVIDFYGPADFPLFISRFEKSNPDCVYQVIGADMTKPLPPQNDALMDAARLYSPITYVNADYAPTLIFHGVADGVVPVSQSSLFYEALRRAGVRSELIISNAGVHDVNSLGDLKETEKKVFDFLREIPF